MYAKLIFKIFILLHTNEQCGITEKQIPIKLGKSVVLVLRHFSLLGNFGLKGIRAFCSLRHILGLGALGNLERKNQTGKLTKFIKVLNYIKFSCNKLS